MSPARQVVVLYDNQYNGRFWPCVEFWSSLQVATPEGLLAEEPGHRRTSFVCVASSEGTEAEAQAFMERQWRHVTVEEAINRLLGPDLLVTNQKDKEVQVRVLQLLDRQTAHWVADYVERKRWEFAGQLLGCVHPGGAVPSSVSPGPLLDYLLPALTRVLAVTRGGNHRVSSSTLENLASFLRAELSCRAAWTLVTVMRLFPVYCEKLKLECCGAVCALPNGRLFMGCKNGLARVVSESGVLEVSIEVEPLVSFDLQPLFPDNLTFDVVLSVCALPDGRIFTGWRYGCARVFSSSGVKLLEMEHDASSVVSVCVLPDGRLVTGSDDGTARVFSDSGIVFLKRKIGGDNLFKRMLSSPVVFSVCALLGGRILTGCSDGFARVFSDSGVELLKLDHGGSGVFNIVLRPVVFSVCALPGGRILTGCSDGLARVFSDSGVELLTLRHTASVDAVCALPDGRLVTGCSDGFARIFTYDSAELVKLAHGGSVRYVSVLPNGRLVTGCSDGFARIFADSAIELLTES